MRLKILPLITGGALFIGALALQACGDSSGYAYGPGGYGPGYASSYGYAPTYVEPAPVYASPGYAPGYAYAGDGDYDEQHVWRERDWWVNNRRDWVMAHHQAWLNHERAEGQARATYRNQVQEDRAAYLRHQEENQAAARINRQDARGAYREHLQEDRGAYREHLQEDRAAARMHESAVDTAQARAARRRAEAQNRR